MNIRSILALVLTLPLLSADGKPLILKFRGNEGLVREYSFSYSSMSVEVSGKKKVNEQKRTFMQIIERVLSTDPEGTMEMEVDFEKVSAYRFKKKTNPPFFPSLSSKMTSSGNLRDIKTVNPFDVSPGSPLPPYKEYMGSLEFPRVPVEEKDAWQYENKVLLPFNVIQNTMITATFKGMGEYRGRRCALIETRYKTQIPQVYGPLQQGLYISGTAQRRAESCFNAAAGEVLRTKGETTYNLTVTNLTAASPGVPPSQSLFYLEEKFTISLVKKLTE